MSIKRERFSSKSKKYPISRTVRNMVLAKALRDKYLSVADFCRKHPELITYHSAICLLLRGLFPTRLKNGEFVGNFTPLCQKLSEIFGIEPDILFNDEIYDEVNCGLSQRKFEKYQLPFELVDVQNITAQEPGVEVEACICSAIDWLARLTPVEQTILMLKLGFDSGNERSFRDVGAIIDRSHERVRQIYLNALRKLRRHKKTILEAGQ